jgi:hypothetical protein
VTDVVKTIPSPLVAAANPMMAVPQQDAAPKTEEKKDGGSWWDKAKSFGGSVIDGAKNLGTQAWGGVKNLGAQGLSGVKNFGAQAFKGAQNLGGRALTSAQNLGIRAINSTKNAAYDVKDILSPQYATPEGMVFGTERPKDIPLIKDEPMRMQGNNTGTQQVTGTRLNQQEVQQVPRLDNEHVPTYETPYKPLTPKQRKLLKGKVEDRTISQDEYNRLQWDRRFSNRRQRGVDRFWGAERRRLRAGGEGTRNWTPEQKAEILAGRTPTHNGKPIEGHHKHNALDHPQVADDGNNIYPATWDEHFHRWHGGNFQNDTFGEPFNPYHPEDF